ncbi:MAG: BolA/IbaG family iron-sulfur metabolism protein [Methylococcaceae bacterium]|nr:BolA/IbaG family iron-sulfur metabolism protein [Methylococcaceae bacterium]
MEISSDISSEIKQCIEQAIENTTAEVICGGNRHYTLTVTSNTFDGLTQVKQHQLVYASIKQLMYGNDAPIHAIDQLTILTS